jgi:hypothetical protein
MNYSIFDIESDGLLEPEGDIPAATKIHCMSVTQYRDGVENKFNLVTYDEMRAFLKDEKILIGHNITRFDAPMLEKFLGIQVTSRLIDTLALSWYLYPNKLIHGIEEWGKQFGIEKPYIEDWHNQSLESYIFRCDRDVQINTMLFNTQMSYLKIIYGTEEEVFRLINYLMFKMQVAREQEEVKWKLDVAKCTENLGVLLEAREKKIEELKQVMPKNIIYAVKSRPKNCFKKDNSVSAHGEKWFELLKTMSLPEHHMGALKVPVKEELGNPKSQTQLKAWLFSLGWEPDLL